jgi:two-component system chemotaxis response regulator CheB
LDALEIGAVDFVAKPKVDVSNTLQSYAEELVEKVKAAAKANIRTAESTSISTPQTASKLNADAIIPPTAPKKYFATTEKIIALGSSTGGTEAVKAVVKSFPKTTPAIVISQHLPIAFSASFAKHVDDVTEMTAWVAEEGQEIKAGNIYIAPGDKHLLIIRKGERYVCQLNDGPPVNRHKPSVEVMFRSIAQNVGSNAIGVMLTGMGDDGAVAMKEMLDAGSLNVIQDEASSVVWGMPGEAYRQGAAHYIQPLDKVAAQILALV